MRRNAKLIASTNSGLPFTTAIVHLFGATTIHTYFRFKNEIIRVPGSKNFMEKHNITSSKKGQALSFTFLLEDLGIDDYQINMEEVEDYFLETVQILIDTYTDQVGIKPLRPRLSKCGTNHIQNQN